MWDTRTSVFGNMGTQGCDKQVTPDFCAVCVKYNFRWCQVNKLTSVFHVSVQLLIMNFVITL